jgi:hypothetical protein
MERRAKELSLRLIGRERHGSQRFGLGAGRFGRAHRNVLVCGRLCGALYDGEIVFREFGGDVEWNPETSSDRPPEYRQEREVLP